MIETSDTGTHEVLADATGFIKVIEKRTGLKIAWRYGWVTTAALKKQNEG